MAVIIFDFDGTIADSFDYIVDFLATEAGIDTLTPKQREDLRNQSMAAMALDLGHSRWRLPFLFLKGRRQMRQSIDHLVMFEGMRDVIMKVHNEGHELFILSSNNLRNIRAFLHREDIHEYFLQIYAGVGLFSKAPALRRLLRDHSLDKEQSVYIGDETRDVLASQRVKMRVIAVTWGFARDRDLRRKKPTYLVETREELLATLEEI